MHGMQDTVEGQRLFPRSRAERSNEPSPGKPIDSGTGTTGLLMIRHRHPVRPRGLNMRIFTPPTKQMLDDYKKHRGDWSTYEARFLELMRARRVERTVARKIVADACCCAASTLRTDVIAGSWWSI